MRIFVSHSTRKVDGAGLQRITDLEAALKQAAPGGTPHEILIDFMRLEPGFRWRTQLDEWMAECNAAVLMLTPEALKSWWVLKEATIVAHRAALDTNFFLFPVLLDGVTRADLTAPSSGFSPLYLEAIQRITQSNPGGIAAEVHKVLNGLPTEPQTALDRIASALANHLEGMNGDELERICTLVTGKAITSPSNRARRCANALARAVVVGSANHYKTAAELVQDLLNAGLDASRARRVLNLVAPLWVDMQAAALLVDLANRNVNAAADAAAPVESWASAMNGAYISSFSAEMYMRRAYLPNTTTMRTIAGGQSDIGHEELVTAIRQEVRRLDLKGDPTPDVDAYLANMDRPYFIVLPPPLPDDALLTGLQRLFPKVTFIAQAERLEGGDVKLPDRALPLLPELDLKTESRAHRDYNDAMDRINA